MGVDPCGSVTEGGGMGKHLRVLAGDASFLAHSCALGRAGRRCVCGELCALVVVVVGYEGGRRETTEVSRHHLF